MPTDDDPFDDVQINVHWPYEEKNEENKIVNDSKAIRIMQKMGYQHGFGLGKDEQGIKETPIICTQLGKRGLGLKIDELNYSESQQWDFSKEEILVEKKVNWLTCLFDQHEEPSLIWIKEGLTNHNIEDEKQFCNPELLTKVFREKNIFNHLDAIELGQARGRANSFETIKSVFFMNRAALKMADLDAATDFCFSNIDQNPHFAAESGPFYFADVCAGPGGFSEYLLWRRKWLFKGFGLTLKDDHDFKVNESQRAPGATFQALYGKDGDGDVCSPENIEDFTEKVKNDSDGNGVHFMMSDGGFSVEGNENIQEILSKNIYICQCLLALEVVRPHGNFVTKLFDIFTPFSVGLLYLMHLCFEKVGILKPNTSRPANSERYFVCYNLKSPSEIVKIKEHLWIIVKRLWEIRKDDDVDILEIVPMEILKRDQEFFSYIYETNSRLAKNQVMGLEKLAAFCRNPNLIELRQEELRKQCLEYWKIPDIPKIPLQPFTLGKCIAKANLAIDILLIQPREINTIENLSITLTNLEDWHYVPLISSRQVKRGSFYVGVEQSKVYRFQNNKWVKVKRLQLVQGTLLYGEMVKETTFSRSQSQSLKKMSLHVIDALQLGDKNLQNLTFLERMQLIQIYCKSVNKECQTTFCIRIRPKTVIEVSKLTSKQEDIKSIITGGFYMNLPVLGFGAYSESFEVNSVLLLKTDKSQSFQSTHVLRVQIFINEVENGSKVLTLKNLTNFFEQKL